MKVETAKRLRRAGACAFVFASWGCSDGKVLDLGGDAPGQSAGDGSSSSYGSASTGSGGTTSGLTDGAPANAIACDYEVCSAPDVCCSQSGKTSFCEAASECNDVAVRCRTDADCPAGSSCCYSGSTTEQMLPPLYVASTQCFAGATCPSGSQPTCSRDSVQNCGGGMFPEDSLCVDAICINLGP
ncbi:MAG: hypothetical protein FWD17_03000 [Polyangiaceae bacterium]|nr:hypothetical protein [Polyangiaceae bacterium]